MNSKWILLFFISSLLNTQGYSLGDSQLIKAMPSDSIRPIKWYDQISLKGYIQLRYNRLLETNENLACEACDRSWGKNNSFSLRRVRLSISGKVNPKLSFQLQTDFASSASSTSPHFNQIKDAYFDYAIDNKQEFKIRFGQSKIPFGFETIQSSSLRLPFDRSDAINSGVANERDLGMQLYWTPKTIKNIHNEILSMGLKGSGDYGLFNFGIYNGQTGNKIELNNQVHMVLHTSLPFKIKNQIAQIGIDAYNGKFVVSSLSKNVSSTESNNDFKDQRIGMHAILFPKPIGIQLEYNAGKGPKFNRLNSTIEAADLSGGYAMLIYNLKLEKGHQLMPFVRYQIFDGGKKAELDARAYNIKEWEIGIEWQLYKAFEITASYLISDRRYDDGTFPGNYQKGNLLRLQAQCSF